MKRIAAFVDGTENDGASLAAAAAFAKFVGARLAVVHATRRPPLSVLSDVPAVIEDESDIAARAALARRAFEAVRAAGADAEWFESDETEAESIRRHGIVSDAVVLERVAEARGPDVLALNTALFETGAPVLVCPPARGDAAGEPADLGGSVALVWSPTVQSARVARSALPVLQRAGSVTVLTNTAERRTDAAPVLAWLEAHGVAAGHKPFDGSGLTARGRGRAILAAAAGIADLMVMGAYGENNFPSLLGLGRATQKVLTGSTIPVLVQT
jgi:nucleotide-binding universal stress UspA family protein